MDQTNQTGLFVRSPGADSHTLQLGSTRKGMSVMPDNSELTIDLAERAFKMLDRDDFHVSAALSADNPAGLRAFGEFQSILLMAYRAGQESVLNQGSKMQAMDSDDLAELFAPDPRTGGASHGCP